ncbi:PAS domain S-box protein [Lutibacter citreus]|uniref:PAS domain S-box protein n=1 Tax=Lutibacter citreus TaxID=2138210 RepID=UPI000DBE1593|nr:PAS domain S-box protein [Lutibacter citreus]
MALQPNPIESTLDFLIENGYNISSDEFLKKTAKYLSSCLGVKYVLISKYSVNQPLIAESIISYGDGGLKPNITYNLLNTPYENVIDKRVCVYQENIQSVFPLDKMLVNLNVSGFVGISILNSSKEPIGLLSVMNDGPLEDVETIKTILKIISIKIEKILERIIYEDILYEIRIKFEELSNSIYEGILIHDKGIIKSVNKAFEKMFGYASNELVGFYGIELLFPKKHQDFIKNNFKNNSEKLIEVEGVKKDGSIFSIEIILKEIKSINNKTIKFCLFRDLTNIKQKEIENKKLLAAVEQSANAIIITDINGIIEYVNPKYSKIIGYSKSEVLGQIPDILKSDYHSKAYFSNLWSTISSGKIWKGEFQNKNKKGELYWEQATISQLKNAKGEITNYLVIKEDINERKIAEVKLKEAYKLIKEKEDYLTRILKTANEGYWIIDLEDKTVSVNTKMCFILGYKESEIIGKHINDFVNDKNNEIFKNEIKNRKFGISSNYEIELMNANGQSIPCLFNASPVYNQENIIVGSFALVTNISNLKKVYKELEVKHLELKKLTNELSEKNRLHFEIKNRFRNLFDESPVSLWDEDFSEVKQFIKESGINTLNIEDYFNNNRDFLIECISKIKIIRVNKSTFDLIGVNSIEELKDLLETTNTEESFKSMAKELTAVAQNKSEFYGETQFKRADGKLITAIIKSEINTKGKAIVSIVDISALKEVEYELNKSKIKVEKSDERYRLAVSAAGLGIWDWNIETDSIYFSTYYKKQLGYKNHEFENKVSNWRDHLHPDESKRERQKLLSYLKNPKKQYISEFRYRHKNGSYIWILARAEVLKNEKGEVIRMFGSHRDISVRKKALIELEEQRLELIKAKDKAEESNRLKTEFLHNMSHEIRTPMNGILGFSNFLSEPNLSVEKRKYYINIINNSGNQLLRVIDDILEISRLETKQVKVIENSVCINDLLMELFSIFDLKAKENGIPIYLMNQLSDNESTIFTDRSKLNKVLSNLLENALKYTNKGYIKFGYHLINSQLELFVKDTGIGICVTKQESIFERFSQEETNLTLNSGGLGLGLSIAKENTELLGGNISIISEKGKGSKFVVSIPYKPVNKVLENKELQSKIINEPNKYTVLIVEDEEVNFMFIEILLTEKIDIDFKILHAKNGKEAVDICKNNDAIDIVLMDINMPILNGYEATKQIRVLKPNLPIIAQTAYSTIEDKEKAEKAGCNSFISKPIQEKTLRDIMDSYLLVADYKHKTS